MLNRPRPRPLLPLSALAALVLARGLAGCGSACKEVQADRDAFEQRTASPHEPDVRLALPFPLIDAIIAEHLAHREPVRVELPLRQLGLAASLDLQLEAVHLRRERPHRVGVTVSLGLYDRPGHKLATIGLEAAVVPIFEPARGDQPAALAIRIRASDLGAATPTIEPGGRDALAEWLEGLLPPAVRMLADRHLVGAAADELLGFLAREIWPSARDRVLGKAPFVDTQLALPSVPAEALTTETQEARGGNYADALVVALTSSLPVASGLDDAPLQLERGRATLRMAGATAAELVNQAMASGKLPAHFDEHGKANAAGPWEARTGWQAGARPLKLYVWQTVGTCKRASLGAELQVATAAGASPDGPALAVHVADARLESVHGPSWLVAFAWLDAAFSDALDFTFRVARIASMRIGQETVRLAVDRVAVDRLGLSASFAVDVAR